MNKGGNMDMKKKPEEIVICQVCKKQKKLSEVLSAESVRGPIINTITKEYPDWLLAGISVFLTLTVSGRNMFRM
jgi:hypothetical protein